MSTATKKPTYTDETQPPCNRELEEIVIGSILLGCEIENGIIQDQCREAFDVLTSDDFYFEVLQDVFACLQTMAKSKEVIGCETVANAMHACQSLQEAGGQYFLRTLAIHRSVSARIDYYVKKVLDFSMRRKLVLAANEMKRMAWDRSSEARDSLAESEILLKKLADSDRAIHKPIYIGDGVLEFLTEVKAEGEKSNDRFSSVLTGIDSFDDSFGGMFPGELIILAARPGGGKTTLGLQIAYHVSRLLVPTYTASIEMNCKELAARIVCGDAGVSLHRVRAKKLSAEDITRISEASQGKTPKELPMIIHELNKGAKVADIRRESSRLLSLGLRLIVVDYLQHVTASDKREQRHVQVGQVARDLKQMAMDFQIPVLAIAQLGRAAEGAEEPRLHHLRESGDIEAEADMVLLLSHGNNGETKLSIAKNRQGRCGDLKLIFDNQRGRYECENKVQEFDGSNF